MRLAGRLYGVLCLLSVLQLSPAHAAGDASPGSAPPVGGAAASDSSRLLAQLQKMQSSAQRLDYSGSFVYQQAALIRTSRVTHVVAGGHELEKLEVLDGKPREYLRSNDDVASYSPDTRTVVRERRVTRDTFPAIVDARPEALASHYQLIAGQDQRVAGRDCHVILLQPRDALRYGYRFWTDAASGLLLRAQTLDGEGAVMEQISFTQIQIGGIDRAQVSPTYRDTRGWRVEQAAMSPADLSAWQVLPPPGFRKISAVRRMMSGGAGDGQGQPPAREVSQLVFSDGLAAISVFIEPAGPGQQDGQDSLVRQGALNVLGRRQGDYWLTVVGEVPEAAIRQVLHSIELKSK